MTELTKSLVNDAIDEEFNEAKGTEEPVFTSLYEAYAYLKEQVDVQNAQSRRLHKQLAYFWENIRRNENDKLQDTVKRLQTVAYFSAIDSIKVAAMAKEINEMLIEE